MSSAGWSGIGGLSGVLGTGRQLGIARGTLAEGVCCSTWLKGRQPFIRLEQFQQHWGEQGALYQVSTGALLAPVLLELLKADEGLSAFQPGGAADALGQGCQAVPAAHTLPVPEHC